MNAHFSASGACRLSDRGLIRARGADAATFLQGQLTSDVAGLAERQARLAGFCSAKGRLQASFVVWREAADDYLLACASDLLAATCKRLSMFVLRAKCKLSDAGTELALWGLVGDAARRAHGGIAVWAGKAHAGGTVIRLPDAAGTDRCLLALPAGREPESAAATAPLALAVWHWLEVQSGIVTIEAATVDRFVPQMVNYERVGGVDFQKGCYPGQEVVARSQYRGTTKRRTFLFDCDSLPAAGQDVFAAAATGETPPSTDAEAAGTVANAAPRPDAFGGSALVELRLAALASELRLGSPTGPLLRQTALPYALTEDENEGAEPGG